MLANGATLGIKKSGDQSFTDLPGLKEIPEMGTESEKVDNTVLTDTHKKYEKGIGDLPEMTYKFKYDNTSATSPYRVLRELSESGETATYQEKLADGTLTEFEAQVSVKRTGGAVNGVVDFEATMTVQSDLKYTDPAGGTV